jgi:hypothetical protein
MMQNYKKIFLLQNILILFNNIFFRYEKTPMIVVTSESELESVSPLQRYSFSLIWPNCLIVINKKKSAAIADCT